MEKIQKQSKNGILLEAFKFSDGWSIKFSVSEDGKILGWYDPIDKIDPNVIYMSPGKGKLFSKINALGVLNTLLLWFDYCYETGGEINFYWKPDPDVEAKK